MGRIAAAAAALVAAAAVAGCAQETPKPLPPAFSLGPPGGPAPAASSDPHGDPHAAGAGMPAGHPPVAAGGAPAAAPAEAPPPSGRVGPERFSAPEGWQSEKPAGSMRLLQFRLPRADGDAADGEVTVFGNAMGSTKANIERWRGQFTSVAQGKDSLVEITEGVKGKVHLLDVSGKYGGGMAPAGGGAPAAAPEGSYRMVAAVAELPDATFYVKATGPEATIAKWEPSIRKFILDAAAK